MLLFVAIQLIIQITLNYCVDGSISHFKFPKVVQAHTLGEVGNLGTISLRVCSRTTSNFYWNRFVFDRKGAKNKLAQFFLRHGVE